MTVYRKVYMHHLSKKGYVITELEGKFTTKNIYISEVTNGHAFEIAKVSRLNFGEINKEVNTFGYLCFAYLLEQEPDKEFLRRAKHHYELHLDKINNMLNIIEEETKKC